jgi:very-short-patch-repair endonuclease
MTPSELKLWSAVRRDALGARFRRQAVIRGWIADFWCPAAKLVVEVDGAYHERPEQRARDTRRDAAFAALGIRVVRLTNEYLERDFDGAVAVVREAVRA